MSPPRRECAIRAENVPDWKTSKEEWVTGQQSRLPLVLPTVGGHANSGSGQFDRRVSQKTTTRPAANFAWRTTQSSGETILGY
jgi:hypothetical protein